MQSLVGFRRFPACAVERRAFLVGANPTRNCRSSRWQPERCMEVTT